MNREAAIEAGARVASFLIGLDYDGLARREKARARELAAAVLDAALPHLVGKPIRYAVVDEDDAIVDDARDRTRLRGLNRPGNRVVALIPVVDTP